MTMTTMMKTLRLRPQFLRRFLSADTGPECLGMKRTKQCRPALTHSMRLSWAWRSCCSPLPDAAILSPLASQRANGGWQTQYSLSTDDPLHPHDTEQHASFIFAAPHAPQHSSRETLGETARKGFMGLHDRTRVNTSQLALSFGAAGRHYSELYSTKAALSVSRSLAVLPTSTLLATKCMASKSYLGPIPTKPSTS